MEQLKTAARDQSLRLRAGLVRYYDNEVFNGPFKLKDVPFRNERSRKYLDLPGKKQREVPLLRLRPVGY